MSNYIHSVGLLQLDTKTHTIFPAALGPTKDSCRLNAVGASLFRMFSVKPNLRVPVKDILGHLENDGHLITSENLRNEIAALRNVLRKTLNRLHAGAGDAVVRGNLADGWYMYDPNGMKGQSWKTTIKERARKERTRRNQTA